MPVRDARPAEAGDAVAELCLDVPPGWRDVMAPHMEDTRRWLRAMANHGLTVTVALGPRGGKRGLVECVPVELAPDPVHGQGSLFINCLWVIPSAWGKGVAKTLLEQAVEKAEPWGGLSVLAYDGDKWFDYFPYMPVAFFERFGFREVDRDGSRVLLHLELGGSVAAPELLRPKERALPPAGRTLVEVLYNCHCPWAGLMVHGVRRAIARRKRWNAEVREVKTDHAIAVEEYGLTRGVCVDGAPVLKRLAGWKEAEAALVARLGAGE